MSLAQEEERRSKKVRGGGFGMEIGSRSESYARVLFLKRVKYCWKGLDSSYALFSLKSVRYSLWNGGGEEGSSYTKFCLQKVVGGTGQCCSFQGEGSRGQADCLKHLWGG